MKECSRIGSRRSFPANGGVLLLLSVLFFIGPASASGGCETLKEAVERNIDDLTRNPEFRFSADPWTGLTLGFGYRCVPLIPGKETLLWVTFGTDLSSVGYYLYPDGTEYSGGDPLVDPGSAPFHLMANPHWSLGISQGLLWSEITNKNLLELYSFFRVYSEASVMNLETGNLWFDSGETDHAFGYLIGGITYTTVRQEELSRVYRGGMVDVCFSWGPDMWPEDSTEGLSFGGVHSDARLYLPIVEKVSSRGWNLFSIYTAFWLRGDWVFGTSVPQTILSYFSGRIWEKGMGGAVRGVDKNRFPTPLKFAGSGELRFNLPSFIHQNLLTGLFIYFDTGYFHYLGTQPAGSSEAGFLMSTGGGFFLDLLGVVELSLFCSYYINGNNVDGTKFTPLEFEFGLHY